MLTPTSQKITDRYADFAQARRIEMMLRGPLSFSQLMSIEYPLLGPWMKKAASDLCELAIKIGLSGEDSLKQQALDSTIKVGLSAERYAKFEREQVTALLARGMTPSKTGALRDEEIQRKIGEAAAAELQGTAPEVAGLVSEVRQAFLEKKNLFEERICDLEREERQLNAVLPESLTGRMGHELINIAYEDRNQAVERTLEDLYELMRAADNSSDRLFIQRFIDFLKNSQNLRRFMVDFSTGIKALKEIVEKGDKISTSFWRFHKLANERARGSDPWYELIEYETWERMRGG